MSVKSDANESPDPAKQGDLLEHLKWTLDGVQEQIRFADSKAGVIVLFHTFLFGFIITQAETLSAVGADGRSCAYWLRVGLLAAYAITSFVSMCFAVRAVHPHPGLIAPQSKIYHGHIVANYDQDFDGFHKDLVAQPDTQWQRDLSSQILVNSHIACTKHRRAGYGICWAVAALICAILGIASLFLSAGSVTSGQTTHPDSSAARATGAESSKR